MRTVLVIEEDTLIRELMREHLEREGYAACAVANVRIALDAARWTKFSLVLLDFASASACASQQLAELRAVGAPVLMMSTGPRGSAISVEGEVEQVVWSPFDLATLTSAVRRFLPESTPRASEAPERRVASSGTYVATRPAHDRTASTMPAPADDARNAGDRVSLEALGELVLEATGSGPKQ